MAERGRQEALAAAKQAAVNFVSISVSTVCSDMQRIIYGATGEFKEEYEGNKATFRTQIVENKALLDRHRAAGGDPLQRLRRRWSWSPSTPPSRTSTRPTASGRTTWNPSSTWRWTPDRGGGWCPG